tara:strand:- start:1324 stop:3357 length:2034 start_codon:yes stop_codon:yes gene_type:complete
MNQSVVIRCLILLFLVQQINSGDWFQFEKDTNDDFYDVNVDFKLDEIDDHSDWYGSDYNRFGDVDEKMDMHDFFASICLWGAVFILGTAVIDTQGNNAKRACTLILFLSLINGCTFLTFPSVLEEEAQFFTDNGVDDNDMFFMNRYSDANGNDYEWGPEFAWYSSIIVVPIYCMYLFSWIDQIPNENYSKSKPRKKGNSLKSAGINVPNSTFTPNGMNYQKQTEPVIAVGYKRPLENEGGAAQQAGIDWKDGEIKFSKPKLQKRFDPMFTLNGINASYLVEGIITYSGCSEILFGTRTTDGRMVVIKKPYGYRNQKEKGKNGMVNTHASAKKQLENEYQVLYKIMEHNKSNFPELIDRFDAQYERRKEQYVVMKYFDPSLKKYVKFHSTEKGGLEYGKGIELFIKIAESVNVIHEKLGYVWADLKSENILMERNNPILIDFGTSTAPVTTKAKVKIDSGGWSAPETIKGYPVLSSDIYSLGKLLGYILTGIPPKSNQKPNVFKAQILHEIRKRNIDTKIADVILKCTDEEIENRYDGVLSLLKDLDYKIDKSEICPNCDLQVNKGVAFCRHCGHSTKPLENEEDVIENKIKECNACNFEVETEANFCHNCGNNLKVKEDKKFSPGIKIEHEVFGTGIIKTSELMEAYALDVKFDNGNREKVSSTHVQIKSKKVKREK